jgi:alpha-beta hydrolase superfamily lysophospholipase
MIRITKRDRMSARTAREADFIAHDGTALFYRHWPATAPRCRGAIVLLHRGHEHSARVAHLVDELDLPDFAFFAWDARPRPLARRARLQSGAAASVRDLQSFVEHIRDTHGVAIEDIAVVGQSVGAVLAAAWAHDYAPPIRCLVLASPAFHIKLYVPFARPGLRLMHKLRGLFYVNSYVKPKFLTHDPQRIASYAADPLITRPIAVNMLLDLHDTAQRIVADAAAITVPTQLLISGADWVVHRAPQDRFFERLGAARKGASCCRASITTRSASATARRRSRRCARSCCANSTRRARACRSPTPTGAAHSMTNTWRSAPRREPVRARTGRWCGPAWRAAHCRTASRSGCGSASIRARRSTTCTAIARRGASASVRGSIAPISTRRAGPAFASASCTCRS